MAYNQSTTSQVSVVDIYINPQIMAIYEATMRENVCINGMISFSYYDNDTVINDPLKIRTKVENIDDIQKILIQLQEEIIKCYNVYTNDQYIAEINIIPVKMKIKREGVWCDFQMTPEMIEFLTDFVIETDEEIDETWDDEPDDFDY